MAHLERGLTTRSNGTRRSIRTGNVRRVADRSAPNDHEAIRRSLAQLCQLRDRGRYDEWIELFAPDGTFDYGGPTFRGRAAILEHCSTHFPAHGKHLCTNSVIDVDGDEARVLSDFMKLHPAGDDAVGEGRHVVVACGRYQDRFVRIDGTWLLAERHVLIEW